MSKIIATEGSQLEMQKLCNSKLGDEVGEEKNFIGSDHMANARKCNAFP